MIKEYTKEDCTIIWDNSKCVHSAECVKGLPNVFKPKEKPWVQTENGPKEQIIEVVGRCPSGALSIK